jgi:hypothetical protein
MVLGLEEMEGACGDEAFARRRKAARPKALKFKRLLVKWTFTGCLPSRRQTMSSNGGSLEA